MNPKSVICCEPLIVPAGVSVKYEDVAADIASTSVCIEDVNVFSELISPPEPYEPVFDSIWSNLWSKDAVVDSITPNLTSAEDVYWFRYEISVEPPPPPPPVELIVIPPLPEVTVTFMPPINAGLSLISS